ncbi:MULTISPECIES: RidA family protein [Pseudovibrio]|uniref:RidA family protein n=1 Tax=Stappiaceae TaxID=2821832 RepID=UPI0023662EB5|nr:MULTISPECIES: RidA family protein [Pseudovibrio]MDD7911433.1 RidA family protein [Pseudovibrio exalbescens]MDX5594198.1 RidA family protein [Pseudovibrio sp. SPO723]
MISIDTKDAPAAIGPYVQGVTLGDLVITSGQLPIDVATGEMPATVEEQTLQSLKNALAIVEEGGLTVRDIMKTTVFVKDLNDFAKVNEVYGKFFEDREAPFPARSCVEVARLPKDALVEIEVLAYPRG